jgi:dCTP deaminase
VILTDREIKIYIDRGLITIDPRPDLTIALNSTAVDLTLDPIISEFKEQKGGIETIIDPSKATFRDEEVLRDITDSITIPADGYVLKPHNLILGWTLEYIDLKLLTPLSRSS